MLVQSRAKACATCIARKIKVCTLDSVLGIREINQIQSAIRKALLVLNAFEILGNARAIQRYGENEK